MESLYEQFLPELLRVLLLEQVDTTRTILLTNSPDFNDVVHDTRTGFKKIRAYLLLLKTELGGDVYKTASRNFRAEGKGIAELRDSYVVIMTLEQLFAQYPGRLQNNTVKNIQNDLAQKYEAQKQSALQQDELSKLAGRLPDIKNRIINWDLPGNNDGPIFDRLQDRYSKGAKQMTDAATNKNDKNLHNWRKNVKHLWYQVRVFEPCKPDILTAYAESLHSLSDFLGQDHDLAVLNAVLSELKNKKNSNDLKNLRDCISSERMKLQAGAFPLARSIYAESADQFADRLAGYWRNRVIKQN